MLSNGSLKWPCKFAHFLDISEFLLSHQIDTLLSSDFQSWTNLMLIHLYFIVVLIFISKITHLLVISVSSFLYFLFFSVAHFHRLSYNFLMNLSALFINSDF